MPATGFAIADGAYGAATPQVREIVEKARDLRWFPADTPRDEEIATVREILSRHLGMIASNADPAAPNEIIHGAWDVLATAYRAANPITPADDPAYGRGQWRRLLGTAAARRQRQVEAERPRSSFRRSFRSRANPGSFSNHRR